MKKNTEENENTDTVKDIHGRIESFDQNLRSVDSRLRAIEKRLSIKTIDISSEPVSGEDNGINDEIIKLRKNLDVLSKSVYEIKTDSGIKDVILRINNLQSEVSRLKNSIEPGVEKESAQVAVSQIWEKIAEIDLRLNHLDRSTAGLKDLEDLLIDSRNRIKKLENLNKITIGKIKIPVELSGIVAAIVLIGTGYLIASDKWDIVRSSYYPITIGVLFGAAVIAKFIMSNREQAI